MEKKNVSEAVKEQKAADACLKTSIFGNWKPDYDSAAHHYEKAGQLFKLAKEHKESKACYCKAATYYESCRVLFSVGKCYEAAALCAKELGDFHEAHKYIELAGSYYTENGTATTAVQCYNKGAESLSTKLPELAAQLYLRSGELEQNNDHPRDAIKAYLGAKKIYARNKMYKECVDVVKLVRDLYIEQEHQAQVGKCNMSLVILHLARGDSIAAKSSIEGDVSLVADELIEAVESGDEETIKKLAVHADVVYLDTDIARIAKFLSQDGAQVPADRAPAKVQLSGTVFKSAGNNKDTASLRSQRNELFSRPNKENRDELFSKKSNVQSNQPKVLVPVVQQPKPVIPAEDSNPFSGEPDESNPDKLNEASENSNPFSEEPVAESNPFQDDEEEDLC